LRAYEVKCLFSYKESKIFLKKTNGNPQPSHEIAHIGFFSSGSSLPLTFDTIKIIEKYRSKKFRISCNINLCFFTSKLKKHFLH